MHAHRERSTITDAGTGRGAGLVAYRRIAFAVVCAAALCLASARPVRAQRARGLGGGAGAIRYAARAAAWGSNRDYEAWNAGFGQPLPYSGPKEVATVSPSAGASPVRMSPRPGSIRVPGADAPAGDTSGGDPFWDIVRMSDYLKDQPRLTLWITMTSERVAESGQKIQLSSRHVTYIQRPDKVAMEISTEKSHTRIVYDGSGATVVDTVKNIYGTILVQGALESVLHTLGTDYGMAVPADDLFFKGDYDRLKGRLRWADDLGKEMIDGRPCYHSVFSNPSVNVQTWVESRERPVPRRVVIIDNSSPGRPRRTLDITRCETGPIPESAFQMDVPAGAQQIEIVPRR